MCLKNECNIFLSTRLSKLNVMRVKLGELVLFVGTLVCLTLLCIVNDFICSGNKLQPK